MEISIFIIMELWMVAMSVSYMKVMEQSNLRILDWILYEIFFFSVFYSLVSD